MTNETTDWPPPPAARDMIDWLGLFVARQCTEQRDVAMCMAVRDTIVRHFGMDGP